MRALGFRPHTGFKVFLAVACFVIVTLPPKIAATEEGASRPEAAPTFGDVSISLGLGYLSQTVSRDFPFEDSHSDFSLLLGVASPLSDRIMWGMTTVISAPIADLRAYSLIEAKLQFRFYPALNRRQRHQVYLSIGGLLVAGGERGQAQYGGGAEVGVGVDLFVGRTSTVFVEAGFAVVGVAGRETEYDRTFAAPLAAQAMHFTESRLRTLLHVMLGTRFGI